MGKAMTVTDTKTLWGKDPDKRNPCFTSICLKYSHFRVQSYLHSQFSHIFVWTIKITPGGGGGHLHINLDGTCSPCSLLEHLLFELLRLRAPRKVIINWQSQPIPGNNSLFGVFQNKILPVDL